VLDDPSLLQTAAQKGNFAEMVGDAIMERDGYIRLGPARVTSINQKGHDGIDGIYYKAASTPGGKPEYVIVDQKYATDGVIKLGQTRSGTQLSPNWIGQRIQKYFNPNKTGIDPADQIHADALQDYFDQAIYDPLAPPSDIDVSIHAQGVDGTWKLTDTSVQNTDNSRVVTIGATTEIALEEEP
jgi:hypothetical protein